MFGFWDRAGVLAVAAALLFAALRVHKSSGKHVKLSKPVGVILAFLAGLAMLTTLVGSWMQGMGTKAVGFGVAGLIVCAVIIAVDWGLDKKPDKPAFWAGFALPLFLVIGMAQIPAVGQQIGNGGQQVTSQISRVGGK